MTFAIAAFLISLFSLTGLFLLKHWEHKRGTTLVPGTRRAVDAFALRTKDAVFSRAKDFDSVPPFLLSLLRLFVHLLATSFGQLAHWIGRRSHDLADLVSHKRHFERRQTNSEFLRRVTEHSMRPENPRVNTIRPIVDQEMHPASAPIPVEVPKTEIQTPAMDTGIILNEEPKPAEPKKPRTRRTPRKKKDSSTVETMPELAE